MTPCRPWNYKWKVFFVFVTTRPCPLKIIEVNKTMIERNVLINRKGKIWYIQWQNATGFFLKAFVSSVDTKRYAFTFPSRKENVAFSKKYNTRTCQNEWWFFCGLNITYDVRNLAHKKNRLEKLIYLFNYVFIFALYNFRQIILNIMI